MHDIGKVVIPDTVILKKTALSRGERQIIETHAATGAELLARAKLPYARLAEEVARYHHEHWDGRGYPEGLSGNAIPLPARIVGLCDAFDAMVHDRVYRRANTLEEALGQIAKESERQFDPRLVDLFIPLVRRIYAQHADVNAFLTQRRPGNVAVDRYPQRRGACLARLTGRCERTGQATASRPS